MGRSYFGADGIAEECGRGGLHKRARAIVADIFKEETQR
jgi:hypothetical protein